eukprot:767777-Hanusia_phi.AAC.2
MVEAAMVRTQGGGGECRGGKGGRRGALGCFDSNGLIDTLKWGMGELPDILVGRGGKRRSECKII